MGWIERYDCIFFNWYSTYHDLIPGELRRKYIGKNLFVKAYRILKVMAFDAKRSIRESKSITIKINANWIIVDAVNNLQSINDIFEANSELDDLYYFTYSSRFAHSNSKVTLLNFPDRILYFHKMLFYTMLRINRIRNRWDFFLTEYGWYEAALKFMKRYQPQSILFTNDHTPINRAMMLAARTMGIKTGYIQHACVRDDFGELLMSHAFLDGQDSVDKYAAFGHRFKTKIHLIGMPKLSKYLHLRSLPKQLVKIGIAFNTTDDLNEVSALILQLQNSGFLVMVRPHPKDRRPFVSMHNIEIDDASKNNAFYFLGKIDALVAGESAIHLESILLNKPSFQFDFNKESKIHDLYGFLRKGLVKKYKLPEDLLSDIYRHNSAPEDVYRKGAYYDVLVDDVNESLADKKAFELIRETLFKKDPACAA